jgi:hypothetical protein
MALYLPFLEGAGPSCKPSVIACLPFSMLLPFVPLIGRGVSSVRPGAIFVGGCGYIEMYIEVDIYVCICGKNM